MDYRKTLNLPKTSFSMKANLREKEPKILKEWEEKKIYEKILKERESQPQYILHDGPPYANGHIHMGHALNKILKDIIVKYKSMKGYSSPYVPGWDCHGLPIELNVVKDLKAKGKDFTLDILRKACRSYARKFVDIQKKGFKRLGIFGLWNEPYLTMSHEYESAITQAFGDLVKKDYIYRGLKPVHWCSSCETALAEAEVEYKDSSTPTVFVKFSVQDKKIKDKEAFVVIWTTTPWTLPANVAVCFHPDYKYVAVKAKGQDEYWIMADELIAPNFEKFELEIEDKIELTKSELESLDINHPFLERKVKPVFDTYVTLDTGTGVVHIAPGHGEDDYSIGLRYSLPVLSPVDHQGKYTKEFEMMEGEFVFDANEKIIDLLKEKNKLIFTENLVHSYPHCWRCKHPVIFRATQQWFMKIDHNDLRAKAIDSVQNVQWVPQWGEGRMVNMLESRPDWCLSRQRAWGVPIPAFFCKDCGETLLTDETIAYFVKLVKEKSVDIWFTESEENLLPKGTTCPKCGGTHFKKETDILDVWFDSGVSNFAVVDGRDYFKQKADIYLEGNDQYRGWFQSSLWPSVALKGEAPYKTVLTHGFMLDETGRAMHKSEGNTISPDDITNKYGADILRLWVLASDYKEDMRLGEEILKRMTESYRMFRNTIRFIMGNLNGFNPNTDKLPIEELEEFDVWALDRLVKTFQKIEQGYETFEFNSIFHTLINFLSVDLSATYFNILKDRLYAENIKTKSARSARTVLVMILEYLTKGLAPLLSFSTEEIWSAYKTTFNVDVKESIHLELFPDTELNIPNSAAISEKWDKILSTRDAVKKALEILRADKVIGSSLEAKVLLQVKNEKLQSFLEENIAVLPMVYITSQVKIVSLVEKIIFDDDQFAVGVEKADGTKCVRCWKYSDTVGQNSEHPELCHQCVEAIS